MGKTCSLLPQYNGNLPLPFYGGNYPPVIQHNIYLLIYMYINWFIWIIFINGHTCYTKMVDNDNSPDSLNVLVN